MPNWCTNKTSFYFVENDDMQNFLNDCLVDDQVVIHNALPMPEILEGTQSPPVTIDNVLNAPSPEHMKEQAERYKKNAEAYVATGFYDWHSWQLEHWGIKWGACDVGDTEVDRDDLCVSVRYNTPWSPFHYDVYERISDKYHCVIVTLCDFEGEMYVVGRKFAYGEFLGEVIEEFEMDSDYEDDPDGYWDEYTERHDSAWDEAHTGLANV